MQHFKQTLVALAFACMPWVALAQDMIVTNDGKTIKAYHLEISATSVFYQLTDQANAPLQKMAKGDILIIKKADGTKIDFDAPQPAAAPSAPATPSAAPATGNVMLSPSMLSAEGKAQNDEAIGALCAPLVYESNGSEKEANYAILRFKPNAQSVVANEEVTVSFKTGRAWRNTTKEPYAFREISLEDFYKGKTILVQLSNKTNRTLYIDLGNSMLSVQGVSKAFYVPQTTTTSSTGTTGASVNLGALTGSRVLSGVSVGGASSSTTVSTTYAQRVLAVPPMGICELPFQWLWGEKDEWAKIDEGIYYGRTLGGLCSLYLAVDDRPANAACAEFDEAHSPLKISTFVSYAYTENCAELKTLPIHFYLSDVVGVYQRPAGGRAVKFQQAPGLIVGAAIRSPYKSRGDVALPVPMVFNTPTSAPQK